MAVRLNAAADEPTRERLPHAESLRRMIRSWEAGEHRPSELYAELYRRAFGTVTETAFDAAARGGDDADGIGGFVVADSVLTLDDEERLVRAARAPRRLDSAVIDSLAVVLAEQRRTEDRIGSVPLIAPVRAQLAVAEKLVSDARGPLRGRMLDLGGQWAQFAGWLHASAGRWAEADRHYDRALQWGSEVGNADLIATALNMKGHLAWLSRTAGPLISLSQAAQRDRAVSHGVRALAVQQEARGLALAGEADSTDRKFDEAAALTSRAAEHPEDEPPWIYFFGLGYLTLQRGLAYRYLGRYGEAIELLHRGLQALDPQARRAEWAGAYILQMAIAHAALGDIEQACSAAGQVADIADQTESTRLRAQLLDLHRRLLRVQPRHSAVAVLGERLR
ncbi:XRE family transcriptional regulator [Sphaerisporangium sp. NPDC051017]|uniref:XRE family transcriptional regulator n=1 Tax=Sphaerisporangium sp. NPDC051017 TaxID=3154636 RepID=UPI00344724A1